MDGRAGRLVRRFSLASLAATAMLIAVPSGASAGTQIGETFHPDGLCGPTTTRLQSTSPGAQYAAPSAGVITRWSYEAAASNVPQLKFKVGRFAGGDMFTMIGESAVVTPAPDALNSYLVRIPVNAGDLIGNFTMTTGSCNRSQDGYAYHSITGDVVPPTTAEFPTVVEDRQLDVSAILEPDCDKDGLGDETQDGNLSASSCPTPPTCKGKRLTIVGTPGDDEIVGTDNRDVIGALDGNDRVRGLDGKDLICGGKNKDTLKGGKGKDKLLGQKGKDKLRGGGARDVCKGGKGDDSASKCEVERSL